MINADECSICTQKYKPRERMPLVLICGHTYCTLCITSFTRNNYIKCPTCRKTIRIAQNQTIESTLVANRDLMAIYGLEEEGIVPPELSVYEDAYRQTQRTLVQQGFPIFGEMGEWFLIEELRLDPRVDIMDGFFEEHRNVCCLSERVLAIVMYILGLIEFVCIVGILTCMIIIFVIGDIHLSETEEIAVCILVLYSAYVANITLFGIAKRRELNTVVDISIVALLIVTIFGIGVTICSIIAIHSLRDKEMTFLYIILVLIVPHHILHLVSVILYPFYLMSNV